MISSGLRRVTDDHGRASVQIDRVACFMARARATVRRLVAATLVRGVYVIQLSMRGNAMVMTSFYFSAR